MAPRWMTGLLLGLAGCSDGGGDAPAVRPDRSFGFPIGGAEPDPMRVVEAYPNLAFDRPLFATHAPDGSERVFVVEQGGRILVFPDDAGVGRAGVFLDITARVTASTGEQGLLGMAFDPRYTDNGWFYVHYTEASPRRSVIARYRVTRDPDVADPASGQVLLTVDQPFSNHNAGMLAFGPDGMLYLGFGDGGSGGDPLGNGQDRTTLLGSLLRIDPHGGSPYGIPPDNPFVGAGGGVREEIWAYGLRNPWRFSFDRATGELWLADVGQNAREEIDRIVRGGNYGWNVYEGDLPYANPGNRPATAFEQPVHAYGHDQGNSITGGYVYRGNALPSLRGAYVYGDHGSGAVWALVVEDDGSVTNTRLATLPAVASFGETRDGELLLVQHSVGKLFRLEPTGPAGAGFPQRLSETGLFADLATLTPVRGLEPYGVHAPLWSDGAVKRRWLGSPHGAVGFAAEGPWTFPVGTVLVKHFELELIDGDPTSRRRLETRVLLHEEDGWAGYTYRWNDAQTDAVLLGGRREEAFTVIDPAAPGGQRQQTWVYPGRSDCMRCHTEVSGRVLGVRTLQLAGAGPAPDALARWTASGLLVGADPGSGYDSFPDPADPGAPVARRARAYLATNCAMCHQPGGPTPSGLDLRWGVPVGGMNAVDVRPVHGDLGLQDPWVVRPGSKESSVLWERMRRLDGTRMPPLASRRVDRIGVEVIGAWIDDL